jgi:hypothetical protein
MRTLARQRYGRGVFCAGLAVLVTLLAGCPSGTPLPGLGQWRWQNPLPQGNSLFSVWNIGPNSVLAVGAGGTIGHYDGSSWFGVSSGTRQDLHGLWGFGPQDVYAAGSHGTILHFNGLVWSAVTSGTTAD